MTNPVPGTAVQQPEPAPKVAPQAAPKPPAPDAPGKVTLAVRWPMGSLTLPPLDDDGEAIVITEAGTEVDEATAVRAREAAALSGLSLVES